MKRSLSTAFIFAYCFGMALAAIAALGAVTALTKPQSGRWTGIMGPPQTLIASLLLLAILIWRLNIHLRARSAEASVAIEEGRTDD